MTDSSLPAPLRFSLAVHIHQPVGNFDHVFEEHLERVYAPFLDAVAAHGCFPLVLHVSGPLLDWLEAHAPEFVDRLGDRVASGDVELLGSGRYEPVLAALPRRDRIEQVEWMREFLARRFGVEPRGLWLTERVWEPDLATDLVRAGVSYTLLDDRHFLAAGLPRAALDRPYRTEDGGDPLAVLSIDERLRYLVPFRPVPEIERFFEARAAEGCRLLVLGDDGEKFGGWPGTHSWVYEGGWLDGFLDLIARLRAAGRLELVTAAEAAAAPSGGIAYPAPGSYREMEEWTLPREAALELEAVRARVASGSTGGGASDTAGTDAAGTDTAGTDTAESEAASPWIRGGQWRGFLFRYPESNRMHKATLQLRRLCRERGDPAPARREVARARCNDAYWHGVFGGIYQPHLRAAAWAWLAKAEAALREGEALAAERIDWDLDGHEEVWVHSGRFSAVVSPRRGGAIEVLSRFDSGEQDADVLARHLEAYHLEPGNPETRDPRSGEGIVRVVEAADAPPARGGRSTRGAASIHQDGPARRAVPTAIDRTARALFQERVFPAEADLRGLGNGTVSPLHDWSADPFELADISREGGEIALVLSGGGGMPFDKRVAFGADGTVRVDLAWDASILPDDARVSTELSLAYPRTVEADPEARVWRYDIITLARSERGFEEIRQGESVTLTWPARLGRATAVLAPGRPDSADVAG